MEYIANGFIPISLKYEDLIEFINFAILFNYNIRFIRDKNYLNNSTFTNPNTNEIINVNLTEDEIIDNITAKDLKRLNKNRRKRSNETKTRENDKD